MEAGSATSARSTGQTVGHGQPPGDLSEECQTGQDANEREDCRILASINSIQAYWNKAFRGYEPTATRLFDGSIQTGCGGASSAVGPFYCPNDRYVYIDLGFFDQLQSQLGAEAGRSPRRTSSPTSTATTSRT